MMKSTVYFFVKSFFILIISLLPMAGLQALAAEIEEIVVTARAEEESVRDIPVAITAVTEERLDTFGLEGFMDLEAITPQLSIGRGGSGSGASIGIRGIASTSSSIGIEQSVSVVIDGVYFPQGRAINEGLFDVRQVAILKGPQALYFGKNATAGVISVETNDPGDQLEASIRVNNEFESDDLTVEGILSLPVNDKLGLRLAVQASNMDGGWIENNAGADTYATLDAATFAVTRFENPEAAGKLWPGEETFYARLTAAGDVSDTFSYNVKASFTNYKQNASSGGSELFDCPTLAGQAHNSQLADPQPSGRQTPLYEPLPINTDCTFNGARGINDVPPGVAATNPLLNEFGNGDLGEEFESWSITGTLDWSLENLDVTAIINHHDQQENWVSDFDGGGVTSIFAGEENTFDNTSIEVRAVTSFDSPVNYVFGAFYQQTDRWFVQDVIFAFLPLPMCAPLVCGPDNSLAPDLKDRHTAYNKLSETDGQTESIYAEIIWDINDELQLTAGLRYLHETKDSYFLQPYVNPFVTGLFIPYDANNPATIVEFDQTFDDTVPEITIRYMPKDDLTFYAAYKEGFKSGGFSNSAILSNLSPPGGFDFVFDEETVNGGEVGVKAALLDGSVVGSFEVFFYQFEDLQVDFFNSQQFAFVTENAGGSETYGAELQFDWATPLEGLALGGSIGLLKSKFTDFDNFCYVGQTPSEGCQLGPTDNEATVRQNLDGNTRPGAPEWAGHLVARYERNLGDNLLLGITANTQYKSETVLSSSNPTLTYDPYWTVDANVRVGSQDGQWQIALIGKNLTDKLAIRGGGAVPSTGGNTGTTEGFQGDYTGGAIRPRQVELEFQWRL